MLHADVAIVMHVDLSDLVHYTMQGDVVDLIKCMLYWSACQYRADTR